MDAAAPPVVVPPTLPGSARIERRFYSIVRWFGLLATTCALILAASAATVAVVKLSSSPNTHVSPPTVSYGDFQRLLEAQRSVAEKPTIDPTLQQKEREAARATAEAEFERKLKPHLDAIVSNLTAYAAKLDFPKPSAQAIGDFVRRNMMTFNGDDGEMGWTYVGALEKATADLAADGDRLSKLGTDDIRRVKWDQFLQGFTEAFRLQINRELARIHAEEARIASERAQAVWVLYGAGIAFGCFISATVLLVLLRIEHNTRPATS